MNTAMRRALIFIEKFNKNKCYIKQISNLYMNIFDPQYVR